VTLICNKGVEFDAYFNDTISVVLCSVWVTTCLTLLFHYAVHGLVHECKEKCRAYIMHIGTLSANGQ